MLEMQSLPGASVRERQATASGGYIYIVFTSVDRKYIHPTHHTRALRQSGFQRRVQRRSDREHCGCHHRLRTALSL